jgi:hypothetical protein
MGFGAYLRESEGCGADQRGRADEACRSQTPCAGDRRFRPGQGFPKRRESESTCLLLIGDQQG